MSIKLIKVQRDLKVGIITVVDFLRRKGFSVDENPNTKITDEEYELLIDEFGKNLSDAEKKRLLSSQIPEVVPVPEKQPEISRRPEEIKTVIPEDNRPKFNIKGKIDLRPKREEASVQHHTRPEKAPIHEEKKMQEVKLPEPEPTPVQEAPVKHEPAVKPAVEEQTPVTPVTPIAPVIPEQPVEIPPVKQPDVQKSVSDEIVPPDENKEEKKSDKEDVFRLPIDTTGSVPVVKGKIDLASLNQSTRPKKKSREQKRKEREEKLKASAAQRKANAEHRKAAAAEHRQSQAAPNRGGATNKPGNATEGAKKKDKRARFKVSKVDIDAVQTDNKNRSQRDKEKRQYPRPKPVKPEVNEEDVQKQVKETLARLTSKGTKSSKGAKYRKDKRDAAEKREQELQKQEERESKVLKLPEFVTANDLASMMDISVSQVISTCMSIGIFVSINQRLDAETINIVAEEFGFKTEYVSAEVAETIKEEEDNPEDYVSRPPIVTVMGHVDHGKTSLLDNIRNANVIAGEAGGITQHIGAYNVKLPNGRRITFLDTPGHEAFTAMRARGAKVTDIVIIIVAADDNVMPQTVEAINHASVAGVPIVFAINKIDKPNANPEKIKEELSKMNYLVEDWGGKYQSQEISAKKGIGVQELLEKVLLEADMLELKANPKKRATGSVIESSLDKGRGYVATILVSNGTLHQGDIVLAGTHYGRVKAMFNERNQRVESAGPSEPVLILGLDGAPTAGDTLYVLETEQEAREIANRREQLQRELGLRTQKRFGLEELGRRRALGDFHELNLIVKGDVDGSVEALSDSLIKLSTEEIQVNVIHKAVGQISDSDVELAAASDAVIIGFQVRPATSARKLADKEGVETRLYSVIYDAIEDVRSAMEGMLSPEIREDITGNVEVQQVFKITKVGTIAGCVVKEGKIKRTNKVRVIRDGIVIHTGELASLKRFKDEVKEVVTGQDCGIHIHNYNDINIGDIIESFDQIEIKKTL